MQTADEEARCYHLTGCSFFPSACRLEISGRQVRVLGKPLEILRLLAETQFRAPGRVVRRTELFAKVWGDDPDVGDDALTAQVKLLRKCLHPLDLIETLPGHGYRLRGDVTLRVVGAAVGVSETSFQKRSAQSSSESICIESHKFVPVYLGHRPEVGLPRPSPWIPYNQLDTPEGSLCVFESGVGVWHLRETIEVESIVDLAVWRRDSYHNILGGDHSIHKRLPSVLSMPAGPKTQPLRSFIGKPGYVLSAYFVRSHCWPESQLKTGLKLMCSPHVLHGSDDQVVEGPRVRALERLLLTQGIDHPDVREFGIYGIAFGYASWAGVSLFDFVDDNSSLGAEIIQFELALQSVWWLCHCLGNMPPNQGRKGRAAGHSWRNVAADLAKLKSIGPTEHTPRRTMVEAILATSRIDHVAAEAQKSLTIAGTQS